MTKLLPKKLLILNVAALSCNLLKHHNIESIAGLNFAPAKAEFPAVTCVAQATFRTALSPADHGMIANGLYFKPLRKIMFWEQASSLVEGQRIWHSLREKGGTVGMMFWQQSMGEQADLILTPAPIHKHHGGIIMDCYSKPAGLYESLQQELGKFSLAKYWGPFASASVGNWIAKAVAHVAFNQTLMPDCLLAYLPSLDYDLQRFGPEHEKSRRALNVTINQIETIAKAARENDHEIIIFGDYDIARASGKSILPNNILRQAGLFTTRKIRKMLYPDFHQSRAIALADHEVAWIYTTDSFATSKAKQLLEDSPGVAQVLSKDQLSKDQLAHENAGDLLAIAEPGKWFGYQWWTDKNSAPDYASHVDIHNKPGFDPCELFGQLFPPGVSQNSEKIQGSHGLASPDRPIAWASTIDFKTQLASLRELAALTKNYLSGAL